MCHEFYSNLYADQERNPSSPYAFIPTDPSHKISQDHFELLDEEITKDELHKALKNMKKGTAPGLDGLTVSFLIEFWDLLGDLVFNSIKHAYESGRFSISQRRGIIKLVPKKDKNPHFVRNLRPITLLNIDYKLLTKSLAMRLCDIMQDRIGHDQNAFIRKRYIGNNIMDLYSIIAAAEEEDEEAILILLDIEKAFDTINRSFIQQVLTGLGFPPSFLRWLQIMQTDKELRLFNNGYSSLPFTPKKGVAQGCALSPLIYIFVMETLAEVTRQNTKIVGVKSQTKEKKISLVADDTLLSARVTEECMEEINNVLDAF